MADNLSGDDDGGEKGWINPRRLTTPLYNPRRPPTHLYNPRRSPTPLYNPRFPPNEDGFEEACGLAGGGESLTKPWRYGNLMNPRLPTPYIPRPSLLPKPSPVMTDVSDGRVEVPEVASLDSEEEVIVDYGLAGGEGDGGTLGSELEEESPSDFAPVYFPWKPSTEEWAKCDAIADEQCDELLKFLDKNQ